jgi:hypothetical protein
MNTSTQSSTQSSTQLSTHQATSKTSKTPTRQHINTVTVINTSTHATHKSSTRPPSTQSSTQCHSHQYETNQYTTTSTLLLAHFRSQHLHFYSPSCVEINLNTQTTVNITAPTPLVVRSTDIILNYQPPTYNFWQEISADEKRSTKRIHNCFSTLFIQYISSCSCLNCSNFLGYS